MRSWQQTRRCEADRGVLLNWWVWVRSIGRTHTHISMTADKAVGWPGFFPATPPS